MVPVGDRRISTIRALPFPHITVARCFPLPKPGVEGDLVFVDARSAESWSKADTQIPGSVRVPPDEAGAHVNEVPRGRAIVTYCT
jgi:hypothetical protein